MGDLIDERRDSLTRRLAEMRENHEWRLFQHFALGLLHHDGYTDVRLSAVQGDFGRDGVAVTPDGQKCFVAVSFECTLAKIRGDADRWTKDDNRQDAAVMLFITNEAKKETTVSGWKKKISDKFKLELRLVNSETILSTATAEGVWRETCARLGIAGHRMGFAKVAPYDDSLVRRALQARPPEWLKERVPLPEWGELTADVRTRLIFGKPGAGKTMTIVEQLDRAEPEIVLVVESLLSESSQIEGLLDDAAGGAVIVFDDVHAHHKMFVQLCQSLLARKRDAPTIAAKYENVILLAATRNQEWEAIQGEIPMTVLEDLGLLAAEARLTLTGLDVAGCRHLIEICRDEWKLVIEDRLLTQAAEAAAERDATPLFVISMLAPARGADDLTLTDTHLAGLPKDVKELWGMYWQKLDPTAQGILRLVRLFWATAVVPFAQLLTTAAETVGISLVDLSAALDQLERSLWLTHTAGRPGMSRCPVGGHRSRRDVVRSLGSVRRYSDHRG